MSETASDEAAAALLAQLERARVAAGEGAVHPVAVERARALIRALAAHQLAQVEERLPGWMADPAPSADPPAPPPTPTE